MPLDLAEIRKDPGFSTRVLKMWNQLLSLCRDDEGVTAVEYAVLLALILVAIFATIDSLGDTTSGLWASDAGKINTAIGGS
jgi:pilus assembly protein Flp/PilA